MRDLVERVWFGDDVLARVARAALVPTEVLYRASIGVREALYDTGVFTSHEPVIPAVSVGNVTVGGTGKTPVAAWIAAELVERGARPAIHRISCGLHARVGVESLSVRAPGQRAAHV